MKPRIAVLLVVAVVVAAVAQSAWLGRPAPLRFAVDLEEARARAREQGEWVVVHVRRSDRPLGAQMDRETLADLEVARRAGEGFVHVRVDATSATSSMVPAGAALSTLVVDGEGAVVAELDGYATPSEFLAFLERVRARATALRDPATSRLARAEIIFDLGAITAAERELATLPPLTDPTEAGRVELLRGRLELARGHLDEARRALRATVERYPATPPARDATRLLETLVTRD